MIIRSHCNVDVDTVFDVNGDFCNGSEVILTMILTYSDNAQSRNDVG